MRRITSTSHDEQLAPVISGEKNELTTVKMVSVIVDPSLLPFFEVRTTPPPRRRRLSGGRIDSMAACPPRSLCIHFECVT